MHAAGNSLKKKILTVNAGLLVTISSLCTPLFRVAQTTGELEPVQKEYSFDCIKWARFRMIYNTLISANKETLIIKPEQNIV
jgi:hypothetical protein